MKYSWECSSVVWLVGCVEIVLKGAWWQSAGVAAHLTGAVKKLKRKYGHRTSDTTEDYGPQELNFPNYSALESPSQKKAFSCLENLGGQSDTRNCLLSFC